MHLVLKLVIALDDCSLFTAICTYLVYYSIYNGSLDKYCRSHFDLIYSKVYMTTYFLIQIQS